MTAPTAPHLAHRLPWSSLSDVIKNTRAGNKRSMHDAHAPSPEQLKHLLHFAQCLCDALTELAAIDKSSNDEKDAFDPKTWNIPDTSREAWYLGYYDSIVWGYVELNLLLLEPQTFEPLLMPNRGRRTDVMDSMCAEHHGKHPAFLATHLQRAFDGSRLKPLTLDVQQTLRDHCAKLFQCMFSLVAPAGRMDPDFVVEKIAWRFGFGSHVRVWR